MSSNAACKRRTDTAKSEIPVYLMPSYHDFARRRAPNLIISCCCHNSVDVVSLVDRLPGQVGIHRLVLVVSLVDGKNH